MHPLIRTSHSTPGLPRSIESSSMGLPLTVPTHRVSRCAHPLGCLPSGSIKFPAALWAVEARFAGRVLGLGLLGRSCSDLALCAGFDTLFFLMVDQC